MEKITQYFIDYPTELNMLYIGIGILMLRLVWDVVHTAFLFRKKHTKNSGTESTSPVSVIICARNEAQNLANHLPTICEQNYPNYEVIVVNDSSIDNTDDVLTDLEKKYSNLTHTIIPKDPKFDHGKKLALTIGIKASKYEHLVHIDADCVPNSKEWLKGMSSSLENAPIVLGYGGYKTQKGILNKLIRFDTLQIAKSYISSANMGFPYMGVGRNLAYKKSMYEKANGFKNHYHIKSGDDDLLVNAVASKKNTTTNTTAACFTYSEPKQSFRLWYLQKLRHLTAGNYYRIKHKLYLGINWILVFLTAPMLVTINLVKVDFSLWIQIFTFTYLLVILLLWKLVMRKFREKGFLLLIPLYEVLFSFLTLSITVHNYTKRKRSKWRS
ncbi:MAG: glycosyltransferase [Salinivirgaceae bacterium]|nr:glycosyltransferase [Salinivirgaceae bacterium]